MAQLHSQRHLYFYQFKHWQQSKNSYVPYIPQSHLNVILYIKSQTKTQLHKVLQHTRSAESESCRHSEQNEILTCEVQKEQYKSRMS